MTNILAFFFSRQMLFGGFLAEREGEAELGQAGGLSPEATSNLRCGLGDQGQQGI